MSSFSPSFQMPTPNPLMGNVVSPNAGVGANIQASVSGGGVGGGASTSGTDAMSRLVELRSQCDQMPQGSPAKANCEAQFAKLMQIFQNQSQPQADGMSTEDKQRKDIVNAGINVDPRVAGAMSNRMVLEQKLQMEDMLEARRKKHLAEVTANQQAAAAASEMDRYNRFLSRNNLTDSDDAREQYRRYKVAAFHDTISAPQPGALDARAAVQAQDVAAANAAGRQAHAFGLLPGTYAGPAATQMGMGQVPTGMPGMRPTHEVNQAAVQAGDISDVMRQAQARSAEMASPAYSHMANQVSHIKQMMDVKGMSPLEQQGIINKIRNGEITLDDAMGFLQGGTSLGQYQANQTAALQNLGLTNIHPGLRPF